MKKKRQSLYAWLLKAPLLLLVVVAFGASIYAAANQIQGVTYGSSVVLGLLLGLYVWGEVLAHRKKKFS